MARLEGKVAVITGGAGDLGKAAASRFIAEGAQVLLVDLDEEALAHVCQDIDSPNVQFTVADVTSAADNLAMVAEVVSQFGGVDIFLANAGIEGAVAPITDCEEAMFDQVLAVNVKGPFLGLKAVIPVMIERGGGSVIISSSVAGLRGSGNVAPYSTSYWRYSIPSALKTTLYLGCSMLMAVPPKSSRIAANAVRRIFSLIMLLRT